MNQEDVIVGMPVTYYGAILENGEKLFPFDTTIKAYPYQMSSGEVVCMVEGKSGVVSIKHLFPR